MANPVLNDAIFRREATISQNGVMTVKGTLTKALLLLILVIAAGAYTWKIYYDAINPVSIAGWMWGGLIVGLISAIVISFKPKTAPFLSPIYALHKQLRILYPMLWHLPYYAHLSCLLYTDADWLK